MSRSYRRLPIAGMTTAEAGRTVIPLLGLNKPLPTCWCRVYQYTQQANHRVSPDQAVQRLWLHNPHWCVGGKTGADQALEKGDRGRLHPVE